MGECVHLMSAIAVDGSTFSIFSSISAGTVSESCRLSCYPQPRTIPAARHLVAQALRSLRRPISVLLVFAGTSMFWHKHHSFQETMSGTRLVLSTRVVMSENTPYDAGDILMKFYFRLFLRHEHLVDLVAKQEGEGSFPSGLKGSLENHYCLLTIQDTQIMKKIIALFQRLEIQKSFSQKTKK